MSKLPDRDRPPQARAVEIVADALAILRTRDGVQLTDEQILERARNAVAALGAEYDLVPIDPLVRVLEDATARLEASNERLRRLTLAVRS